MKPLYLLLALCAIPIVFGAQKCLSWRKIDIVGATRAADGQVFAIVRINRFKRQIWRWPEDLSQHEVVSRTTGMQAPIASNHDGSVLISGAGGMQGSGHSLNARDTRRNRHLWQSHLTTSLPVARHVFFSAGERFVVVVHQNYRATYSDLTVLRAADGGQVGQVRVEGKIEYVFSSASRIICLIDSGDYYATEVVDGELSNPSIVNDLDEVITNEEYECRLINPFGMINVKSAIPIPANSRIVGSGTIGSLANPSKVMVLAIEPGMNRLIREQPLHASEFNMWLLLLTVSIATVVWVGLLVRDGCASERSWRIGVDLFADIMLLLLVCVRTSWWIDGTDDGLLQIGTFFGFAGASFISVLFLLLLRRLRLFYVWAAVFLACLFPLLMPVVGLALLMRAGRYRLCRHGMPPTDGREPTGETDAPSNRSKLRFGIKELLLVTAAMAAFIGIGTESVYLMGVGIGVAVLVAFSVLLSHWKPQPRIVCLFSLFFVVAWTCGEPLYEQQFSNHQVVFVLMIPFWFAVIRFYGYAIERIPRPDTLQLT